MHIYTPYQHVTYQVVLDKIGACPVSHEEWLALKNHWQNVPINLFFLSPAGA